MAGGTVAAAGVTSASRRIAIALLALSMTGVAAPACRDRSARETARNPSTWTTVDSGVQIDADEGRVLAGTLTRPRGAASATWPAVLLLSGSGPQDRDGARGDLPGYAPQRELGHALARHGFVALRLDDRGVGGSTGVFSGATTFDFVRDAARGVAWLRAQPGVDHSRVMLVGHSEGALVALLAASGDSSLAGVVLLGAPSRPGRELARWQRRQVVAGDPGRWPRADVETVLARADREAERAASQDAWLHTWFDLDPRTVARSVHVATLLVHGQTDRQVPPAQASELARALRDDGTNEVSIRLFPSVNHLLLEDGDGDPARYAALATRHVRGEVVDTIIAWMLRRSRPR